MILAQVAIVNRFPWNAITPSARRPDRHDADDIDQKPGVLARGYRFEQCAHDRDMRILADAWREFRDPRELHVVRRQAQMALRRGVHVFLLVQHQQRHVVDAVRTREIAKMHMPFEGYSDRLEPSAGPAA